MASLASFRDFLLRWLAVIWSLFLVILIVLSAVMVWVSSEVTHLPRILAGVFLGTTLIFALADFVFFYINRRFGTQKSLYHPNLKVWVVGILTGIGSALLYILSTSALKLMAHSSSDAGLGVSDRQTSFIFLAVFNGIPEGKNFIQDELVLFLTSALLLALIIWSVVKISAQD